MVVKGGYLKSHRITRGYFLTEKIDWYEVRYIVVLDVPNSFIHTKIPPNKYGEERLIIKIIGVIMDMLFLLDSNTHSKHVLFENGN